MIKLISCLLLISAFALAGCNTVEGVGKDLKRPVKLYRNQPNN